MCFTGLAFLFLYYGNRLNDLGYQVGFRLLEVHMFRERTSKRETGLVEMLKYISITMWKALFGKPADRLQQGSNSATECAFV